MPVIGKMPGILRQVKDMYKSERFKTAYTYKPEETRAEQLRYNHYHDSKGRFTSGNSGLTSGSFPDTIKEKDIEIGRSVGAKAKNYDVKDLKTGEHFQFVEGTRLQDVETFAGKGVKTPYRKAEKYAEMYGGNPEDWQHTKATGIIDYYGEHRKAEVHFSQCEGIGKVDFFIKEWLE